MFFSHQLPPDALIELCHRLRISLSAGLRLSDVFRQLATRGSAPVRPLASRIFQRLEDGENLGVALQPETNALPPLFLAMADLGEQTGHLPEVMQELEHYYVQQQKYRRQLRKSSFLPGVQLVVAVGVVALLIYILGAIAESRGTRPSEVLGFRGTGGAILFLLCAAGVVVTIVGAYFFCTRAFSNRATVDALLLQLPVIGPCVQALVVARFALAMHLTLDTSMPLADALRLSFQATGNAAFADQAHAVIDAVQEGDELTVALSRGRLMPGDFLTMVAVAEEGGKLVEVMRHQAAHYQEEAERRLRGVTRLASSFMWVGYAALMIMGIFRIASSVMTGPGH